jgi:hypothetical protein
MSQCNETFDRIAHDLGGFTCQNAPAFVHLRNPLGLTNWTLPVLEAMMVAGAVFALWWSVRRLRRDGDPTNLALWFASVVYLLATEIPLYFPNLFGVQDYIGVVFDHNVFTVQFLYDRLPLYIVALYPALTTLSFEIVRTLRVFERRRGLLIGALCVGFVHHCFYEVFDQLGPQMRWWAWNDANPSNHPMFASVPMTSWYIFAALGPAVLTALVMWFVGRHVASGRTLGTVSLVARTLAAGALVVFGVGILSIPSSLFDGRVAPQAVVFAVEITIFAAAAVPVLLAQWQQLRRGEAPGSPNTFVRIFGPVYLAVLGTLWLAALPAYFGAAGGITADHTPTGSLVYAACCFALATVWTAMAGYPRLTGSRAAVAKAATTY